MNRVLEWLITEDITPSEVILYTLLAIGGLVIIVSLVRMHRGNGPYKNFNLIYLITSKDGFPDGAKLFEVGAWLVFTWGFIVLVIAKNLSEWYATLYIGAFVLRGAYGGYLRSKAPVEQAGTTEVVETATKTTTVKKEPTPPTPPAEVPAQDGTSNFAPPSSGTVTTTTTVTPGNP